MREVEAADLSQLGLGPGRRRPEGRQRVDADVRLEGESAGRVADERARAAETARLERELARKRRLAAAKNRVTVVGHAATLGADADLAQKEAAVANAIALLPDDVLNFSL